jgi:hypothetical protein
MIEFSWGIFLIITLGCLFLVLSFAFFMEMVEKLLTPKRNIKEKIKLLLDIKKIGKIYE